MAKDSFLQSRPLNLADSLLLADGVRNGEAVNADVTNRLPNVNKLNASYIHRLIKSFRDLSGEFLWAMPIAADVLVGDCVYYDTSSHQFKKALSRYIWENGDIKESETSAVWGIVIEINSGGETVICISGLCEYTPSLTLTDTVPGVRFLSKSQPGLFTQEQSYPFKSVGFLVAANADGKVQFFVRPGISADPKTHSHSCYSLAANPSGDWDKEVKALENEDIGIPGWLSASNPVFEGNAPPDAVFGYNPNFLSQCGWPYDDALSIALRWQNNFLQVDEITPELYRIDKTTIWWCSDETFPWDAAYNYVGGEIQDKEGQFNFALYLCVIRVGAAFESLVTSLRAAEDSGLSVSQFPYGGAAHSGDLLVDFDMNWAFEDVAPNAYAVRSFGKKKIQRSPSVSGIKLDSSRWAVRSSGKVTNGFHHGDIVLGDPSGIIGSEVPIEATHLNGVAETLEDFLVGLSFPKGRASYLLSQFLVPYQLLDAEMLLKIRLGIYSRIEATLPGDLLKISYASVPSPAGANTPVAVFSSNELTSVPCNFACSLTSSRQFYFAESEGVIVRPGDICVIKIERAVSDTYNADTVVLRKSALLYPKP